jgi:Raf kinase inhibitor-like YbhB/YbcL family protein
MLLAALSAFARPATVVTVTAPAFAEGKPIPAQYAYKGKNISPELRIRNVPADAKSLVLIVFDPDSPTGLWTHWLVWNIPAKTTVIAKGKVPAGAVQGKNSFGNNRYDGPVHPSGTHRYFFRIYALSTVLSVPAGSNRDAILNTFTDENLVGLGETYGVYSASP